MFTSRSSTGDSPKRSAGTWEIRTSWAGLGMGMGMGRCPSVGEISTPTKQNFPSPSVLHGPFIYGFLILPPAPWWSFPVFQVVGQKGMSTIFIYWWGHD